MGIFSRSGRTETAVTRDDDHVAVIDSDAGLYGRTPVGLDVERRGVFRNFVRDLGRALRGKPADDVEARAITSVPWVPFNVGPSLTHESHDPLALIPYFACVRILAEQLSALPLQTFRDDGSLRIKITDPQLIRKPAVVVDKVTWTRQMVISLAMRGNAIGIITGFDGMGFATGIEWIHPDQVYVDETHPTMPVYWWANPEPGGGYGEIPRERVVHIAWFVPPGSVVGLSPVQAFARSIGVGLHAQNYGADWFRNGGVPPATFKNSQKVITTDQADEITDRLVRSLRSGRPLTYGADWDFNAVAINPEESQFIQTMRVNATHMAAIFGVPPEWVGGETGGPLTYNSPEQNSLHVYKIVLTPWTTLIEGALSRLLPERQSVVFNSDGLLRGDTKSRYEAHKLAIDAGFLTVDEVREIENRAPLPKSPKVPAPTQDPALNDPSNPPVPTPVPARKDTIPGRPNGHRVPAKMIRI